MTTTVRKAAAVLLAAMLCLSMAFVATSSVLAGKAYAQTPMGTLTVNGTATMAGKNVSAVQMFSAVEDGNAGYTYTLVSGWEGFFQGLGESTMDNLSGSELSAAAYGYVFGLKDAALNDFAREAVNYARGAGKDKLVIKNAQAGDNASAKFNDVVYGYYLVYPAQGSTSTERHIDAMLVNIPGVKGDPNVTWNIKSEYPTVDKAIVDNPEQGLGSLGVGVDDSWEGNHGMELDSLVPIAAGLGVNGQTANVGDLLTFKLTSTVPDMTGYDQYAFMLHDTLSKGLTLLNSATDPKVVVKVDGKNLTGDDYTRSGSAELDGTTKLTIDLSKYLTANKQLAGKNIEVWYQAKVNGQAVIENPNTNDVYVEYTTAPGQTEGGVHDKTFTYTFGFALDKRAGDVNGKPLAGAVFKVYADTNKNGGYDAGVDTVIKFAEGTDGNAGKWVVSENGVDVVTIPEGGKLNLAGFAAGTYFVEETKAPEGYNKLAAPIKVVIAATIDDTGALADDDPVIDYGDAANGIADANGTTTDCNDGHSVVVVNKSGALLPETGGMGTIAFTVVGALAIIGGVVWAVRRKRSVR